MDILNLANAPDTHKVEIQSMINMKIEIRIDFTRPYYEINENYVNGVNAPSYIESQFGGGYRFVYEIDLKQHVFEGINLTKYLDQVFAISEFVKCFGYRRRHTLKAGLSRAERLNLFDTKEFVQLLDVYIPQWQSLRKPQTKKETNLNLLLPLNQETEQNTPNPLPQFIPMEKENGDLSITSPSSGNRA
jgi:hypothetical protein